MKAAGSLLDEREKGLARSAHALRGSVADDDGGALTGDTPVALEIDVRTALESDRASPVRCSSLCVAPDPRRNAAILEYPGLRERRIAALLALAVDVDVDHLVVERDETAQAAAGTIGSS